MGRLATITNKTTLKHAVSIRPSVLQDVITVAEGMRVEDQAEVYALSGDTPKGGLLYCYLASQPCITMTSRHGYLLGMY